jgi:hypothetical protein
VREVISWPSYDLSQLDRRRIPVVADVVPGKHTTRKGWLTKDFHFPQSPFTADIDARIWRTRDGRTRSLRQMARETAWIFRRSIRRFSDPFSFRLLFAILAGRSPSLLELPDRPSAYEDVGRLCRWGMVISALRSHDDRRKEPAARTLWNVGTLEAYVESRHRERITNGLAAAAATPAAKPRPRRAHHAPLVAMGVEGPLPAIPRPRARAPGRVRAVRRRRRAAPRARGHRGAARLRARASAAAAAAKAPRGDAASRRRMAQRRGSDRRTRKDPIPFPTGG